MVKLEITNLIDDLKSKNFFQKMARAAIGTIAGVSLCVAICSGFVATEGLAEIISILTSDAGVGVTCFAGGYYGVLGIALDPSHESYGKIGERKGVAAIDSDGEASKESEKKVIKEFIANVSNKQIINPNPENNTEALTE